VAGLSSRTVKARSRPLWVADQFEKSAVTMLATGVIAKATGTSLDDVSSFDFSKFDTLAVTLRASFAANAGSGVRCELYSSPDNVNWDTEPYAKFEISYSAPMVVQRTVAVDPAPYYLKARVHNFATGVAVSAVRVIAVRGY